MGVRELIWIVVGLLFVYVAYQLYRVFALGRARRKAVEAGQAAPTQAPAAERFQMELEVQQLRRDLAQLRADFSGQRDEVAALKRELADVTARLQQPQKSANEVGATTAGISPEYGEALVFARRGFGVEAIAERCGITVAEAQLVCAIARRGEGGQGEGS